MKGFIPNCATTEGRAGGRHQNLTFELEPNPWKDRPHDQAATYCATVKTKQIQVP